MLDLFMISKYDNQKLIEPLLIEVKNDGEDKKFIRINKDIAREIYNRLGMTLQISKKIYDISPEIWEDIILIRSESNNQDIPNFNLNDYSIVFYKNYNGENIAISIVLDDEVEDLENKINSFENLFRNFKYEMIFNDFSVLQIKLRDEDTNAILLMDLDIDNGNYKLFSGIIKNNLMIIQNEPVINVFNFTKFLNSDIDYEMKLSIKFSSNIKSEYDENVADSIYLSYREILDFIKFSKAKVNISKDSGMVESIDRLYSQELLIKSLNSLGLAYKSLKKMSYLQKSIKCDGITLNTMLRFLCSEYFNENNNINAYVISRLLSIYYTGNSDLYVINEELNNQNS